jgi:hypothetical protein
VPQNYDVIFSMEIINTGNSRDKYYFETEEGLLSENETELDAKENYILELTIYSVQEDKSFKVKITSGN